MQKLKDFGLEVLTEWNRANVPRLAAAFSFFAILSLAPLLVLSVVIAGQFLGSGDALAQITNQARSQMGPQVAELVGNLATQTRNASSTTLATVLSLIVTFFSASGLFIQLNESVNTIWHVKASGPLFRTLVKQRITAFLATIIFGAALVAWLILDSWVQVAGKAWDMAGFSVAVSFFASWLFLSLVFASTYRLLPFRAIQWRDTWPGAILAGFGGAVSKYLFALYFSIAGVGSAYGVAGALVIILLYINYSSQIYLLGSVVTFVYTNQFGSRRETDKLAEQ